MPSRRLCLKRIAQLCSRVDRLLGTEPVNTIELLSRTLAEEFNLYRTCIEAECGDAENAELESEFDETDALVLSTQERLQKLRVPPVNPNRGSSPSASEHSSLHEFLTHQREVLASLAQVRPSTPAPHHSLPKIKLPIFGGDIAEWIPFRDLFLSTVDHNAALSNLEKLHHLRNSVRDEAASLLKTIPLSDANYTIAWETLMDAYDDDYRIVENIISRFIATAPVSFNLSNLRPVYNSCRETVEMLDNQGEYGRSRDALFVTLLTRKLDPESSGLWAKFIRNKSYPTVEEFLKFFKDRCDIYDRSKLSRAPQVSVHQSSKFLPQQSAKPAAHKRSMHVNAFGQYSCFYCQGSHSIYACPNFAALTISEREKWLSNASRCFNCLSKEHELKKCTSQRNCSRCNKRHNSLIHKSSSPSKIPQISFSPTEPKIPSCNGTTLTQINAGLTSSSILPTACIRIKAFDGSQHEVRALIDSGAQATLISEALSKRLGFSRMKNRVPILCLANGISAYTKGSVSIELSPWHSEEQNMHAVAHVVPKLSGQLPQHPVKVKLIDTIRSQLKLADPLFHQPGAIDVILSASFMFSTIKQSTFLSEPDQIYFQDSQFGFLACSRDKHSCNPSINTFFTASDDGGDSLLRRFWELEEVIATPPVRSADDTACETLFTSTTTHLSTGHFCVRLPIKRETTLLGSSLNMALKRFSRLEAQFEKDHDYKVNYCKLLEEYEELGHMTKLSKLPMALPSPHYLIPHHGIQQHGPSGVKFRVVFDASAKSSSGLSLNDVLYAGPRLQSDLTSIINQFRCFRYVLSADIVKMYRQIMVHPDDRKLQLIIWRSSSSQPISIYEFNTVTYGETCSPFLALRTLNELSMKFGQHYRSAAKILDTGRYVDDLFFGADDIETLIYNRDELIEMLQKGGFELRKWASNELSLVESLPSSDLANPSMFEDKESATIKTLGIVWHPIIDYFTFKCSASPISKHTKRILLADTARLFDPMGWISPIIVILKSLFQKTWLKGIGWDDTLPTQISSTWLKIRDELYCLSDLRLNRHFGSGRYELHGFGDASQLAYAAVVYLRVMDPNNSVRVQLVSSKTKLAPIKPQSIPRLELCAAHLLARLVSVVRDQFPPETPIFLWSDSTTVISWIRSPPNAKATFVTNRVASIHELCPPFPWRYVASAENPADLASRGLMPTQLLTANL